MLLVRARFGWTSARRASSPAPFNIQRRASRYVARGAWLAVVVQSAMVPVALRPHPLHRPTCIYAREGVQLDRSTLAGWVGTAMRCSIHWRRAGSLRAGRAEGACRRDAGESAGTRHEQDQDWPAVGGSSGCRADAGAHEGTTPVVAGLRSS